MSDSLDVSRLKVPELRAELGKRGLNTFGTRQVLMDRLSEAIGSQVFNDSSKENVNGDVSDLASTARINQTDSFGEDSRSGNRDDEDDNNSDRTDSVHEGKRKRSPSRSPQRSHSRERESRRSPRRRSRSPLSKQLVVDEPAGWENSSSVFLDKYNSDLSLIIDSDGFTAKPRTDGGFCSMWAGVRANYGVIGGKTFFEVKCVSYIPVENKDTLSGGSTHVMRVGWSTENSDFTLGEEPQSFGYGGTGKKSCNNKFSDYGCTFGEGDVVGAFLEWAGSEVIIRFCVNGVYQGECFRVQKSTLGERYAMFPHVYVKNVEFTVNFGQDCQPPWYTPNIPNDDSMSWQLINNIDQSLKVHGRMPPPSKSECEVIMMVGLPGAGKTYFADRLRDENREKQYNILGTNLILDKMKVLNLSRQRNYHSRWNVLIQEATDCLNVLFGIASKRRRNYILDQTNVYPSAQRRKMRPFEGFKRKAIVIVPTDEEFRRRIAQREKEEGKEVPESAVLEMKANFGIPKALSDDPDSVFDEVVFTELDANAAVELVRKYNQEGQANRSPPEKRQRWDGGSRDRDDSRSDSRHRSSYDRDRGRDFSRGRRDDFRRSPSRRDDRGRRDYRGGYNVERDRSRERYDRGDRFGGPSGRFGGPPRGGGFPGMGPRGGFGVGGARGGIPMRGGRGGPMNEGMGRGYGFDGGPGAPMGYRGDGRAPRGGRGGFRPGPDVDISGGYGNPNEPIYGGAPSGRFDGNAGPDIAPTQGGYRGGYHAAPGGAAYNAAPDAGGYGQGGRMGVPPGRGGRGSGSDRDGRGGVPMGRGGGPYTGRPSGFSAVGYGGRAYKDQDASSAYPVGTGQPRPPSFSVYPPGGPSDGFEDSAPFLGSEEHSDRGRDRFSAPGVPPYGSQPQQPKPSTGPGGYPGGYQRGGYSGTGQTGFSPSGDAYSNPPNPYPPGSYIGPDGYTSSGASSRGGGRPATRGSGASASTRSYPTGDDKSATDIQQNETNSLYASGAAARYGDTRPGVPPQSNVPRQSRFDSKPPASNQPYSSYPQGSYQGGYSNTGAYGSESTISAPSAAPTARTGRSRFDTGPASATPTSAGTQAPQQPQPVSQPQQAPQSAQQTAQSYGYGYASQGTKGDSVASQSSTPGQPSYSYGYGYTGYGGAFGGQSNQPANQNRSMASVPTTAPSLYASAVSDKSQPSLPVQTPSNASSNVTSSAGSSAALAAAASYASYYGYGSSSGSTTNATIPSTAQPPPVTMSSAQQQYGAWQQQQSAPTGAPATTASISAQGAAAAAYASYYSGYSAYTGYGAAPPVAGATAPPPPTPQAMPPQYYSGYR